MKKKLLVLLSACMLLGSCGPAGGVIVEEPTSTQMEKKLGESQREITPVTLENDHQRAAFFADQVYFDNGGNVLVSPLSLYLALGMVAEGASGDTAKELYEYLGREDYTEWADHYMTFAEGLESDGGKIGRYSFSYKLANSIWVNKDFTLNKEYQETLSKKFRAEAQNVDFMGDADKTAEKINAWVDQHTEGMIKSIVQPNMFTDNLKAILANTVYFESPWYAAWTLKNGTFTNLDGTKTEQEMLYDKDLATYFHNDKCTAFAKPYQNGFEFIGILPKQEGEFQLSDLDLESLLRSRTNEYVVWASMPKLNYDTTATNLRAILQAQGVQKVFESGVSELTKVIDGKSLFISDVIQKTKIELDEEGTRAAAVTAIMMSDNAISMETNVKEVKEVNLDRPFAYLIYDTRNDQIVFVGKVTSVQ